MKAWGLKNVWDVRNRNLTCDNSALRTFSMEARASEYKRQQSCSIRHDDFWVGNDTYCTW